MSSHCTIQRRCRSIPLLVPLLGRLAFGRPGVDGGDFVLERRVDEAVPLEGFEVFELGGDDEGGEGLATATWKYIMLWLAIGRQKGRTMLGNWRRT